MCIIIVKNKGVQAPYKSTLKTCYTNNPDGAGYAYVKDDVVFIKKGFMTFADFYHNFKKDVRTETAAILHFRITTQGGVSARLTHPFPLAANMEDLTALNTVADLAIAHNGVIHLTTSNKKDRNDTMEFIADYLTLIVDNKGANLKQEHIKRLIRKLGGASKFAFLRSDGEVVRIGDGRIHKYGLFFSNNSYKKHAYIEKDFSSFWDTYFQNEVDDYVL